MTRYLFTTLTSNDLGLPTRSLPIATELAKKGHAMAHRSDLLIHHGGYGSCQTGLFTGTPAVIIPTFSERESNARRIAEVGAGEYILPVEGTGWKKYVDSDSQRTMVRKVLNDVSYTENARQLRVRLRTYGGPVQAAHLIENFSPVQDDGS